MSGTPSNMIEITLNGIAEHLPPGLTLASLLERLARDPRAVAIEHNGEIVPRERFSEVAIAAGDRLEIVQFVQGG